MPPPLPLVLLPVTLEVSRDALPPARMRMPGPLLPLTVEPLSDAIAS
jgi:hypothetical protein